MRAFSSIAGFFVAVLPLLASPAASQRVEPGTRVRVSAPEIVHGVEVAGTARPHYGTVIEVDASQLVLQTDRGGTISIPFHAMRRLDISVGEVRSDRSAARGALTGGTVGLGMSAIAVLLVRTFEGNGYSDRRRGDPKFLDWKAEHVFPAAVLGGAAVGAVLGSQTREGWVSVPGVPWIGAVWGDGPRVGVAFSF